MFIRPMYFAFIGPLTGLLIAIPAHCATIDDWNSFISAGSTAKFDGKYESAIKSFTKAVSLAETEKLPDKCLPISLCRLSEAEIISNKVEEGDAYFDRITKLIESQKKAKKIDPQVNFWASALADAYMNNHKPTTRELCLKHGSYLEALVYGRISPRFTECLSKLATYYVDENKVPKAIAILELRESILVALFDPSKDRLGDFINDLALNCEKEHKFVQAKELELAVIKLAQKSKSALNIGLPAFYFFLGINALDRNQLQESKIYFDNAMSAARIVKHSKKEYIDKYMAILPEIIWHNVIDNKLKIAENEYKQLLAINKVISPSPDVQYDAYLKLGDVLYSQDAKTNTANRLAEVVDCYEHCIKIAELPHSNYKNALTNLYSKIGSCQLSLHLFNKGNESYSKAFDLEPDKNGFNAALLFFSWGVGLMSTKKDSSGLPKLDVAYKKSRNLPPEKRGTLVADLLQMLGALARDHHDMAKAQKLFKQSADELELQKSLKRHINIPDYYHRM